MNKATIRMPATVKKPVTVSCRMERGLMDSLLSNMARLYHSQDTRFMNYTLLSADELDRYCKRIGYNGSPRADLPTLAQLHRLHPLAIAFENLESWCGRTPALDEDAVFAKLVDAGRGGYCFEQNQLFLRVLL